MSSPSPSSLRGKLEAARASLGKRKEREEAEEGRGRPRCRRKQQQEAEAANTNPASAGNTKLVLAGHLAHEFLSRGTLLGRRVEEEEDPDAAARRRYAEVSRVVMDGGKTHVPGVVNPSQLAQYLQLKK